LNTYIPPRLLFNAHLQTIYPALFRKVITFWKRVRITTPDDDFLDIDWLQQGSKKLVILSHGLEGNSHRPYINSMADIFFRNGYDVMAWNYRGCSEEINKQLRFYHSGATDDLDHVIRQASLQNNYQEINLIGFSLGGNITLKYLGEQNDNTLSLLKKAVVFSVPLDLHASCIQISKLSNRIYANRFLRSLKQKVRRKAIAYPQLDIKPLSGITNLIDFDNRYTAPIHGFKDALDYYKKCSSIHFLSNIRIPALIVNAKNDPFLSEECFPTVKGENPYIVLDYPENGGHCGFASFNKEGVYWSEQRAFEFINTP
jgi:uncharacterized protein